MLPAFTLLPACAEQVAGIAHTLAIYAQASSEPRCVHAQLIVAVLDVAVVQFSSGELRIARHADAEAQVNLVVSGSQRFAAGLSCEQDRNYSIWVLDPHQSTCRYLGFCRLTSSTLGCNRS